MNEESLEVKRFYKIETTNVLYPDLNLKDPLRKKD